MDPPSYKYCMKWKKNARFLFLQLWRVDMKKWKYKHAKATFEKLRVAYIINAQTKKVNFCTFPRIHNVVKIYCLAKMYNFIVYNGIKCTTQDVWSVWGLYSILYSIKEWDLFIVFHVVYLANFWVKCMWQTEGRYKSIVWNYHSTMD